MSYNRPPTFIPIEPPPSGPTWKDRILDGLKLAGRAVGAFAAGWPSTPAPSKPLQGSVTYTPTYNWNLPIPEPAPVVYDNGQYRHPGLGRRNVFDVIKNGEVPPVKGLVQLAHAYDLAQNQSNSQRIQDRLKWEKNTVMLSVAQSAFQNHLQDTKQPVSEEVFEYKSMQLPKDWGVPLFDAELKHQVEHGREMRPTELEQWQHDYAQKAYAAKHPPNEPGTVDETADVVWGAADLLSGWGELKWGLSAAGKQAAKQLAIQESEVLARQQAKKAQIEVWERYQKQAKYRKEFTVTDIKLQKKYKHAEKHLRLPKWSPDRGKLFHEWLKQFMKNTKTKVMPGTYRGTIKGYHYYDPTSRFWVFIDKLGNFISFWKLSKKQKRRFWKRKDVR